ncbi:hypothetical protein BCM0079_4446 [Bacillus cereus]|nr:hypothetical protein BCM0079_4446 [Bacillus cereus]BCD13988.1 hypothetical protein BC30075_4905 [Bacillus cereus]
MKSKISLLNVLDLLKMILLKKFGKMVYSNVKKDLVTINSVATDPEFKHLNMSRFKLQKLEKEGFITIKNENNTPFVSISEIKKYIKIESEIHENYLSIHSFIEQVFHVRKTGKLPTIKKDLLKIKTYC